MSGRGTVVWMLPLADAVPPCPAGWEAVVLHPSAPASVDFAHLRAPVVAVHHASVNSALEYDPVMMAHQVSTQLPSAPEVVVGIVLPLIELHVEAQHAIAHEVAVMLGAKRSYSISPAIGMTGEGKRKIAEAEHRPMAAKDADSTPPPTAAQLALDIATGTRIGDPISLAARDFVYAYTTKTRPRTPFRCTPLQRSILRELAHGDLVATTAAIAERVSYPPGKVSEAITELVNHLLPREAGVGDSRDGHQRLGLLVQRFGAWIRLVESRSLASDAATGGL